MKNSFHTFSCNNYPYAVLSSSFKDRDKEIIALLRPGFTAAWSSGIGRDEPRRSAQNVMENTTCKGTSGCFSVDCASQSVKHDAGCGGAEKRESAEEEEEESRTIFCAVENPAQQIWVSTSFEADRLGLQVQSARVLTCIFPIALSSSRLCSPPSTCACPQLLLLALNCLIFV